MPLAQDTLDAITKADASKQDVIAKKADQSSKEDAAAAATQAAGAAATATIASVQQHGQDKADALALVDRDLSA